MYRYMKRLFDLTWALMMLCLLAPLMAVIALLVRIKLGSPVIFKQQRPGLGEKPFYIYKFRTMADSYDTEGQLLPDELRYDHFGGWIRKLSLDELPQLFNIVRGEMSLIGPRPLLMRYGPYYSETERVRFSVRPGMTGLAQVSGRNLISWNDRLNYDVYYARNLSLKLDLVIFFKTILKVIKQADVVETPGQQSLPLDAYRLQNKGESA